MKISRDRLKISYRIIAIGLLLQTWYMPIFISLIIAFIGEDYIGATDLTFEYMGKEPLDMQELNNMEINSALYGKIWAYAADNEEEYRINYGECGMNDHICEKVDFEDYIIVMSLNRPLTAIRIMESSPVWKDEIPYSYPQFVFARSKENNMVYYYKVYRIDTKYSRNGQEVENRLKLWIEPFAAQRSNKYPKPEPMIEAREPFKRWKWAFSLFYNH